MDSATIAKEVNFLTVFGFFNFKIEAKAHTRKNLPRLEEASATLASLILMVSLNSEDTTLHNVMYHHGHLFRLSEK